MTDRYTDETPGSWWVVGLEGNLASRDWSWWRGPGDLFGTTFSGLDFGGVAVWATRAGASLAVRRGYPGRNRLAIVRVDRARELSKRGGG